MVEVLALLRDELSAQEVITNEALAAAGPAATPTMDEDWHSLQKYIRPALVLLSSRLYRHRPEAAVPLAAVHQFIYLAGRVHAGVAEESTGSRRAQEYQFPVLVGDYLYGRFFTTLCDAGLNHLLGDLARVICAMNEGGMKRVRRALGQENWDLAEIIRLETAELTASCCRLGGLAAGASAQEAGHLHRLGLEVGMAVGRRGEGQALSETTAHLQRALGELALLVSCRRRPGGCDQLERFIRLFSAPGNEAGYGAGPQPAQARVVAG